MSAVDALLGVLVGGTTGLFALLARGERSWAERRARDTFRDYAASRGLRFEPGRTRRASPAIVGEDERTDLYRLGGMLRTRTTAPARRGPGLVLGIAQRDAFPGTAATPLDVAPLASTFVRLEGRPADLEPLARIADTLTWLAHRRTEVLLVGNGASIALSWHGMEEDPLVLDRTRALVVDLAAERGLVDPYR